MGSPAGDPAGTSHRGGTIATFVLVHGAWHGGWCWQRVRSRLAASGDHRVFTPTLAGLAERSHLMSAEVDLDTHVTDVVNLIRWEGLTNIIQPLRLRNQAVRAFPTTYVLATGWRSNPHFKGNFERAQLDPTWRARDLDGSHDLMIDRPDAVAAILLEHA